MSGPALYRKKPVIIRAMQFTPQTRDDLEAWLAAECKTDYEFSGDGTQLVLGTLEGDRDCLDDGYWILQGVAGEFYPVRDDIFRRTYELASPADAAAELTRLTEGGTTDVRPADHYGSRHSPPDDHRRRRSIRRLLPQRRVRQGRHPRQ